MVKIRYLGRSLLKGHPKREFIDIGGERFWNCRRFPEQNDDLSYNRPLEFYEANKSALDDRTLFIVDLCKKSGDVIAPAVPVDIPTRVELSTELAAKGVYEKDGSFCCPACDFSIPAIGTANDQMLVHMFKHE